MAINPWAAMAVATAAGALLGEVRGQRAKKEAETERKREKRREAAIAPWSPWSGMKPERVSERRVNPTDSLLQGAITGGQMGINVATMSNWDSPRLLVDQTTGQTYAVPQGYLTTPPDQLNAPQWNFPSQGSGLRNS